MQIDVNDNVEVNEPYSLWFANLRTGKQIKAHEHGQTSSREVHIHREHIENKTPIYSQLRCLPINEKKILNLS